MKDDTPIEPQHEDDATLEFIGWFSSISEPLTPRKEHDGQRPAFVKHEPLK